MRSTLRAYAQLACKSFVTLKYQLALSQEDFLFKKKKKKAKKQRTKQRNDEEGQEEKEVKGKGEDKKENSHLVCLSIW